MRYAVYFLCFSTMRTRQNGRHFTKDIFKNIFLNRNDRIPIRISLKFVPRILIDNIPALVRIMAWRRRRSLSEPTMVRLLTLYASLGLNESTFGPCTLILFCAWSCYIGPFCNTNRMHYEGEKGPPYEQWIILKSFYSWRFGTYIHIVVRQMGLL